MALSFRNATEKDIPVLLKMMERFYAIDGYAFDKEMTTQNLHQFQQNESLGRLWLLQLDSTIAGYMIVTFCFSFEFKGKDAFIDELYIESDFRNKGLGTEAILFASEQAKILGIKALHLEVENHNKAGIRLYNKFGFKEHNRMLMTKTIF